MRRDYRWVAGFLEGEGSFVAEMNYATRRRKRTSDLVRYGPYPNIRLMAEQKQKWPLQRLHGWFGGGLSVIRRRGHPNPTWCWSLSGTRAVRLIGHLRRHLSPRRQRQIQVALRGLSRPRGGKQVFV